MQRRISEHINALVEQVDECDFERDISMLVSEIDRPTGMPSDR